MNAATVAPALDLAALLAAARVTDEVAARAEGDAALFAAGFRAGYGHGYAIGDAHGHEKAGADLDAAWARAAARLRGPHRAELLARGHIPRDLTRPPALPVRLWDASDWAKADTRDLPTTDHGRAHWRDAIAAGRVPAHLADAFTATDRQDDRAGKDTRAGEAT